MEPVGNVPPDFRYETVWLPDTTVSSPFQFAFPADAAMYMYYQSGTPKYRAKIRVVEENGTVWLPMGDANFHSDCTKQYVQYVYSPPQLGP